MDFHEWFYKVDDSGMNGFDRIISVSSDCDDIDALAALMEKAFDAGVQEGIEIAIETF
jgi:hypothetical protein